jgi:hypothetical protein
LRFGVVHELRLGDIEEFGMEGEKAFYEFLEWVAKPIGYAGLLGSLGYRVRALYED